MKVPAKMIHAPNAEPYMVDALKTLDVQTRLCTLVDYINGAQMLLRGNVSIFFPDVYLTPANGVLPACAAAFRHNIFRCTVQESALIVFSTTLPRANSQISIDETYSRIPLADGITNRIQSMGIERGYEVTPTSEGFPFALKINYATMLFRAYLVRMRRVQVHGECYDMDQTMKHVDETGSRV
jgi:hypothetical protein